jgi:hypothetical protein
LCSLETSWLTSFTGLQIQEFDMDNKNEIPNSKHQITNKFQVPNSKSPHPSPLPSGERDGESGVIWTLEFGIPACGRQVFGIWNL